MLLSQQWGAANEQMRMILPVHRSIFSAESNSLMYRELPNILPQLPTYVPSVLSKVQSVNIKHTLSDCQSNKLFLLAFEALPCVLCCFATFQTIDSLSFSLCHSRVLSSPIGLCLGSGIQAMLRSFAMNLALHLHTVCFCRRTMHSCLLKHSFC